MRCCAGHPPAVRAAPAARSGRRPRGAGRALQQRLAQLRRAASRHPYRCGQRPALRTAARVLRAMPRAAPEVFECLLPARRRDTGRGRGGDARAVLASARNLPTARTSSSWAAAGVRSRCGWRSAIRRRASARFRTRPRSANTSRRSARNAGSRNVSVVTRDVNRAGTADGRRFDRCVSIEMFEHMRNYETLLARIAGWLRPQGKLFVHIFAHRDPDVSLRDRRARTTGWAGTSSPAA